ncbi:hypothetical protein AK812_SmicGene33047 [Symbiodinium microadriaticum]|uniref:Uncharacterized protein n=1 Tax=Symbiodinium microadriaticum TaxID=2951 RepID=A0A1Q9CSK6_SYMMI|nr:hypothetical protein AK812_SmicGene33047 [Symbiodinium microadriaticum]
MDAPRVPSDFAGVPQHTQLDTSSLSMAITLGSYLIQGTWYIPAMVVTGVGMLFMGLVIFLSTRSAGNRAAREVLKLHSTVALLQQKLEELDLPPLDPASPSLRSKVSYDWEPTLTCIDAKLLQLGQECSYIEKLVQELKSLQTDQKNVDRLVELATKVAETSSQSLEVATRQDKLLTKAATSAQEIPAVNKLVQSLCLDVKKGFQLLETHGDSHLAQQREALHLLQSDHKAQSEKLTKLETLADDAKTADKQLSVDLHVCKESLRQKIETLHSEHKRFEGATNSNFRGINPMVPQSKHLADQCKDMLEYLVRANQADTQHQENLRLSMESTSNAEDRIVRVESLCAGLIDQVNEINELLQQVREAQQLQHEQLVTIVERTPKLPKRSPPPEQTSQQTAQAPTLRLSEHLQPLVRDQRPVIMVGDALSQPLNQFSTQDLLRALLNRGTF